MEISRLWCLCCPIPRPLLNRAHAQQHLADAHGVALAGLVAVEQRRADGAVVICARRGDGRAALRMLTAPVALPAAGAVLETDLGVCYDRSADLNHLLDGAQVLCGADLASGLDDSRYRYPPLLWCWMTCAACAATAVRRARAAWRGADGGEAAAAAWAMRCSAAQWYARALVDALDHRSEALHAVAVRILGDGYVIVVRRVEAAWQRGVVMEGDPGGSIAGAAIGRWRVVDDLAVITRDHTQPLTAQRAAADIQALRSARVDHPVASI